MNKTAEIKPCKCGNRHIRVSVVRHSSMDTTGRLVSTDIGYRIFCRPCQRITAEFATEAECIEAWNGGAG